MGELEFDNKDDLQKWLKTRSFEDVMALSSRSALRAVPYLSGFLNEQTNKRRKSIVLPLLRSVAVAVSARWGITEIEAAAVSVVFSADLATRSAHSADLSAEFAARSALSAVLSIARADVRSAADSAARSADSTVRSIAWKAISHDARAIEKGNIDTCLLWHDATPESAAKNWIRLRTNLLSAKNEDWGVWTDWYEAHLRGDPPDIHLERARALIPNTIWKQGPKVANAEIRRLIEEHDRRKHNRRLHITIEQARKLLEQDHLGFEFEFDSNHLSLDASDTSVDERMEQDAPIMRMRADQLCRAFAQANDPYQQDRYDEAMMFAQIVQRPVAEIAENARTLWHLSIGFGSAFERDSEERARSGSLLTDHQRGTLDGFLASSANFVRLFPTARAMDSENLLHRGIEHRRAISMKLIEGSVRHHILLEADAKILTAIERIANEATKQSAKAANASDASQTNLLRRILLIAAGKAGIVGDAMLKSIGVDIAAHLELGTMAIEFARSMKDDLLAHIDSLPADTRGPMKSVIDELDSMDI